MAAVEPRSLNCADEELGPCERTNCQEYMKTMVTRVLLAHRSYP